VNAPGSDCAAGAPGLDSETWEGPEAGVENTLVNSPGAELGAAGEGGAAGTGAVDDEFEERASGLENIRVNSPGPGCAVGGPGLDSETGEGGTGAGETGLLAGVEFSIMG